MTKLKLPQNQQFCFCHEGVSLQMVSGGAAKEGYLGRVTLKIDGEYVEYVKAQQSNEQVEPENRCIRELREFAKANQGTYIFPSWDGHRVLKYLGDTHPPVPTAQPKEPEQRSVSEHLEPVGRIAIGTNKHPYAVLNKCYDKNGDCWIGSELLYTNPPQRTLVGLTDEQRIKIVKDNTVQGYHGDYFDALGIIDDVEAAYGIASKE